MIKHATPLTPTTERIHSRHLPFRLYLKQTITSNLAQETANIVYRLNPNSKVVIINPGNTREDCAKREVTITDKGTPVSNWIEIDKKTTIDQEVLVGINERISTPDDAYEDYCQIWIDP